MSMVGILGRCQNINIILSNFSRLCVNCLPVKKGKAVA